MAGRPGSDSLRWPDDFGRGAVGWSLRSIRYEATVRFYRDLVQLPVLVEFSSSFGEDGTILGLPQASAHLEILREPSGDASAVGHDEIVLYLDGVEAVATATAGLREAGIAPGPEAHPYWVANGATTYRDPDGRALVFAPWVFGRVPDPVDRPAGVGQEYHDQESAQLDWYGDDRR